MNDHSALNFIHGQEIEGMIKKHAGGVRSDCSYAEITNHLAMQGAHSCGS